MDWESGLAGREAMQLKNCWEVIRCGRQPGGPNVRTLGGCPVATAEGLHAVNHGKNGGRACWAVPEERKMGILEEVRPGPWKIVLCLRCPFYRRVESEGAPGAPAGVRDRP